MYDVAFLVVKHPFHLVTSSPWPLLTSTSLFITIFFFVYYLHTSVLYPFLFRLFSLLSILCFWFKDIILERTFHGTHTIRVQFGLRFGIILFIVSELFFFISFFWAYLHFSLSPDVSLGSAWPPAGIRCVSYSGIPLLNTFLLLLSGATLTSSHLLLLSGSSCSSISWLSYTLLLGYLFLCLQGFEY